jgi:nucleotide-binding universal stress UspA family protein
MRVLIAYDGSPSADAAIEDLLRAGFPEQTDALVVCVSDGVMHEGARGAEGDVSWTSRVTGAETLAETATTRLSEYFPTWSVSSEALWGHPGKAILDTCTRWRSDLIVVGSHGHSPVARLFLGSVSMELVHKAHCSIRIGRKRSYGEDDPVRIVIGIDGSPESAAAIRAVAARAWPRNTEAQIISAVQTLAPVITPLETSTYAQEPAYEVIRQADEKVRLRVNDIASESAKVLRRSGLLVSTAVIDADPRDAILAAAESSSADAIFLGARGLGRMERLLLGSVSGHIVNHAHCTVEIVRGQIA